MITNMKRFALLICLYLFLGPAAQSQEIQWIVQPEVEELLKTHIENNRQQEEWKGYRVQILATTDRMKMEEEKTRFENYFAGEFPLNWIHEKPWYKLRAGAFLSKLDAQRTLFRLKERYPGAYLTEVENIEPNELLYNW